MGAGFQRIQNDADAMVDKADRRKVSMRQAALLTVIDHLSMSRSSRIVVDAKKILRKIIDVRLRFIWQDYLFRIVELKPLRWNK